MPSPIGSLKTAVKAMLATRTGWTLTRRATKPGCVVLLYHRVGLRGDPFPNLEAGNFRSQMEWLTRHCNVIAPEQLRDRASRAQPEDGRPDVLVTFDDGYRDYFDHALPVLRRLGIRAINFLCTRFVDDQSLLGWWDRLYLAAHATERGEATLPWSPRRFVMDASGRTALLRAAKDHIKLLPEDDKDRTTGDVLRALDVDARGAAVPRQTMTWDEVRAAADATAYGGHTHNHAIVSRLDPRALDVEIRTCRDRIAAETGVAPETFAYPNGRAIDFTADAKRLLRLHGFTTAFSTIVGLNDVNTDWMEVRRISGGSSVADLAWRLSRLYA